MSKWLNWEPIDKETSIGHDELINMVLLQGNSIGILIKDVEELKTKIVYLESQNKLLKNRQQYD